MESQPRSGSSVVDSEAVWNELCAIVGDERVRPSAEEDRVDGVLPQLVIEPGSGEEVAQVLKAANGAGLQVVPRGGGTKLSWGNTPGDGFVILSTRRLNRVVEHAWGDMTATVDAGCTVQRFQQTLAEHGQRLALDPPWPGQATIGGILATNDSGPLRVRFGSLRDLIIGITLALPDGTLAKSGGKVVKNVAGYDLPKLATGSLGTLGVITQAIFRLHPIPYESRTLTFAATDAQTVSAVILAIQDCNMAPTGLQVRASNSGSPQVDVRFEGTAAGCEAQVGQTLRLANRAKRVDPHAEVWNAHEQIWAGTESFVVGKFALLPTELRSFLDKLAAIEKSAQLTWQLVAQGVGVGLLRLEAFNRANLATAVHALRVGLEAAHGSLVVLTCPREIKTKIDVWGSAGDALPLMKSIKAQFDPGGILNRGRFIGGI
jgi:glycolate oxidase FAD binding subunit